MDYSTITGRYFENLDLPESVKTNLMGRLDLQLENLSDKVKVALSISADQMQKCAFRKGIAQGTEWKKCEGTCKSLITDAVNQEIGSTAFMLKLLADSVIRPDGQPHRLKFGLDPSFFKNDKAGSGCRLLTGQWKDDAPFLRLVLPPSSPNGRLIMGFGPSASGKTHWAKTILDLLAQADPLFPEVFFAVDGGLVRESSAVYQFATEMAHCAGLAGFSNLHAGMFVTGNIKHAMEKYLLQESDRVPISLYVPETLGKCEFMIRGATVPLIRSCESYLKTFMDITRDDKWIGLLIWQHATASDHMKDTEFVKEYSNMKYKCEGCDASGKGREGGEGKPYDGDTYAQSMKNGRKYMLLAPGGRYEIHNSGRRGGTSVMIDRSVRSEVVDTFSEEMKKKDDIVYVDERVISEEKRAAKSASRREAAEARSMPWKKAVEDARKAVDAAKVVLSDAKGRARVAWRNKEVNKTNIKRAAYTTADKRATDAAADLVAREAALVAAEASLEAFLNPVKAAAEAKAKAEKNASNAAAREKGAQRQVWRNTQKAQRNAMDQTPAGRAARMAQTKASKEAAEVAAAATADPAKAVTKAREALAAAEAAVDQEMEKSRVAWNVMNKNRVHPVKKQMYHNAVTAVEAAKGAAAAAAASAKAADAMKAAADAMRATTVAAEEDATRQKALIRATWLASMRGEKTKEEYEAVKTEAEAAANTSATKVAAAVSALERAVAAATAARADAAAASAVMDTRRAMEARGTASIERLATTADAVKRPMQSNANYQRNLARNLTRRANARRRALPVANVNVVADRLLADRLLAEQHAKLPVPAKPFAVLGNEVVPSRFPFMSSIQPASQYHNRHSNGLNELSYD
jgi:hypothetical protein